MHCFQPFSTQYKSTTCAKSPLCNKGNRYEKYGQFPLQKEATGESMKNALYILGMPKGTFRAKVALNSEK